jgi:hypothetical protein
MGGTAWSSHDYSHYSKSYSGKSTDQNFGTDKKKVEANIPKNFKVRESRDNDNQPESIPIIIMFDVTGSMGDIPNEFIKKTLINMMDILLEKGLKNSQILFGAIGDYNYDKYPIQATQFESGTDEINAAITSLKVEQGGGGNEHESYHLAWYFAANKTAIDSFDKRGRKGFLFTIGDECIAKSYSSKEIKDCFDDDILSGHHSTKDLFYKASRMYHTYHIFMSQTGTGRHCLPKIKSDPEFPMSIENLIVLEDYTKTAELIASLVLKISGIDTADILTKYDSKGVLSSALAKVEDVSNSQVGFKQAGAFTL